MRACLALAACRLYVAIAVAGFALSISITASIAGVLAIASGGAIGTANSLRTMASRIGQSIIPIRGQPGCGGDRDRRHFRDHRYQPCGVRRGRPLRQQAHRFIGALTSLRLSFAGLRCPAGARCGPGNAPGCFCKDGRAPGCCCNGAFGRPPGGAAPGCCCRVGRAPGCCCGVGGVPGGCCNVGAFGRPPGGAAPGCCCCRLGLVPGCCGVAGAPGCCCVGRAPGCCCDGGRCPVDGSGCPPGTVRSSGRCCCNPGRCSRPGNWPGRCGLG